MLSAFLSAGVHAARPLGRETLLQSLQHGSLLSGSGACVGNAIISSDVWGAQQQRSATKKAGGQAKQSEKARPKHLGMKMSAGELAFPGMILVRQRGTKFHPGANVGLGRDHTIFSTGVGLVNVSVEAGPQGKERRVVSVEPLPAAVAAARAAAESRSAPAGPSGVDKRAVEEQLQRVHQELVERRGQVKRAMLRGSVPLEPALYFGMPRQPGGGLSWLERTQPRPVAAPAAKASGAAAKAAPKAAAKVAPKAPSL
ncbi:hypothetical protein HYH03_005346 [Edaphochlamys debaryana]|uniref:Ribosomal protein L27 n=1 Tax=Edaphochlamys debaryana TaxID=47281 RepID=A0A835Y7L4_9CHLO|nr:hypothetical protein HYH03_005346 [Edaphochlamys debaryana]|eukprot:KAG2496522.1 hypothetical protein HYH03_005346 [Edaphochlamys debaryana]